MDTAPGCPNREQAEKEANRQLAAGKKKWAVRVKVDNRSEQYFVHDHVWKAAGMSIDRRNWDGALCVGCLEVRIGRRLNPSDFTDHIFNIYFPATPRLLERQGREQVADVSFDCGPETVGLAKPKPRKLVIPGRSPLDCALDLLSAKPTLTSMHAGGVATP